MGALVLLLASLQVSDLSREIDEAIHAEFLRFPNVIVAPRTNDGSFLRRLMLDLAGRPPTEEETKVFLADAAVDKRLRKIDALLEADEFAESWARRFAAAFAPGAPRSFVEWLRDRLRRDRPYGEIAAEIVGALGRAEENPALGYALSRNRLDAAAPAFAEDVSRHFLGVDIYCARCHDHAFDRWTVDQYYALAAFAVRRRVEGGAVAEVAEEDWSWTYPGTPRPRPSFLLGGAPAEGESPTTALARLVTAPGNVQFSKAAVNRVWGWLSDRPLVNPPDGFDLVNRPSSRRLLDALAKGFDAGGRSLRALVRAVCASQAYQRGDLPGVEPRRYDFSRVRPRPLTFDQLVSSVQVATLGRTEPHSLEARTALDAALFLRSGPEVREWIRTGPVLRGIRAGEDKVDRMFLAALSRKPTDDERRRVAAFLDRGSDEDAYWAILNTSEFMSRP